MKLIPEWRRTLKNSISVWAAYIGLLILLVPELLYWGWETMIDPRWPWIASFTVILVGNIFGRIVDQGGLDRFRTNMPGLLMVCAIFLTICGSEVRAADPVPVEDVVAMLEITEDEREEAALEVAVPVIAKWEGLRTRAYQDIVGVWTICYGHTKDVVAGMVMTQQECARMLKHEVAEYRRKLHGYFTPQTRYHRLPPKRDAAYTDLAYNVGVVGAGNSTATKRLNDGNIRGGCRALTWWNKAGKRVIRGLVNRRAYAYGLCMDGVQ